VAAAAKAPTAIIEYFILSEVDVSAVAGIYLGGLREFEVIGIERSSSQDSRAWLML
jgi:hypothetical protein